LETLILPIFNGTNDHIEIPLNGLLLNKYTYSAWALISSMPTIQQGRLIITIDFGGNYTAMNGYTLKITNSLGSDCLHYSCSTTTAFC
jgi:hypothetical protein